MLNASQFPTDLLLTNKLNMLKQTNLVLSLIAELEAKVLAARTAKVQVPDVTTSITPKNVTSRWMIRL
jgi:hypothetical protein